MCLCCSEMNKFRVRWFPKFIRFGDLAGCEDKKKDCAINLRTGDVIYLRTDMGCKGDNFRNRA